MKVYKIVLVKNNALVSCITHHSKYAIKYQIGKLTKPKLKNSLIFTFSNIESAIKAAVILQVLKPQETYKIYEAEAVGKTLMPSRIANRLTDTAIRNFWNGKGVTAQTCNDTVLCEAIKLTKEVKL